MPNHRAGLAPSRRRFTPRPCVLPLAPLLTALLLFAPGAAALDIRLDFDDDGDPATIRTSLPQGQTTATVRFVLVVDALPLPTGPLWLQVTEGCCEAPIWEAHYGTYVDIPSLAFDPLFVSAVSPGFPTCTYCCPWALGLTFATAAPVAVGGRYFIGQATWNATCDAHAACTPPAQFTLTGDGLGGSGPMSFGCPVVAGEIDAWGALKAGWR